MSSPPSATAAAQRERPGLKTNLYQAVMTPVVFVSFLFSLAWVEFRYSMQRNHIHTHDPNNNNNNNSNTTASYGPGNHPYAHQMPQWLHRLIYRRLDNSYVWVPVPGGPSGPAGSAGASRSKGGDASDDNHYHSMQRKLLEMESAEAFRIRTTVLFVMGLVAAGLVWTVGLCFVGVAAWLRWG